MVGNLDQSHPWFEIAKEVHRLVSQPGGMEFFRQCAREAASDRLKVFDEKAQREKLRWEAIKSSCALHGVQGLNEDPQSDAQLLWTTTIHGDIGLPDELLPSGKDLSPSEKRERKPKAFEFIKSKGFPNEQGNFKYAFPVKGWIPKELSPDQDPDDSSPLPVPGRPVSLVEKFAGLAAVYDAYWRGTEKIGPWSDDLADRESNWYFLLVRNVANLNPSDSTMIRSWLVEIESHLKATKWQMRELKPKGKPGPKGPRTKEKDDANILMEWKNWIAAGGRHKIEVFARDKLGKQARKEIREIERAIERAQKRLRKRNQK
jgi:hypothetical protein